MSIGTWLAVETIVALGALLQGAVGFGVALLAAPLLMLIQPALIPAPMIVAAWGLTLLIGVRDRRGVDWQGLRWAVPGLVVGTAAAVVMVRSLSSDSIGRVFGVLVLVAVALSAAGWRPTPRPRAVFIASSATGFMGTATSVGGPPIALVYQGASGVRLRGTLSAVFLVAGAFALSGLALAGRFGMWELRAGLGLLPGVAVGFFLSRPLAAYLDKRWLRPVVLTVSSVAAAAVLVRSL